MAFYGRHICLGYNGKEDKLVDDQGWLLSGDIGWIDDVNDLYVCGQSNKTFFFE